MTDLEFIHFIRPMWLAAVPIAVLVPWLWRRARRPSGDWERICDPHLLKWLSHNDASSSRPSKGHWLAGLALLTAVLALAGPSWQKLPDSTYSARDARVIALDLSNSMLAADLRPDRLTRARFRLADLLREATEGQTGLVAYGGDAYVVSPLTSDTNTIANLLPALEPDVIPVHGSRADLGLDMSATLLERAAFSRGEILLVTDSATAADAAKARELHDRGFIISVLGVGTAEGAPIASGSGFVTDRNGNVVITRLDASGLEEVAAAGGGRYSELTATAGTDASPWAVSEGNEFTLSEDSLDQRWRDFGPWLLLLLLPLSVTAFRRGALFLLPLCMLSAMGYAPAVQADMWAGWWKDSWQRRDQQAWQALEKDENDRAASLAVDPEISGQAWYRSGKYENALGAWSRASSADALYNQGNALAQLGQYEQALAAYDQALDLNPGMEDAKFNRDLVAQLKEQQEQQQKQQQEQDQKGEGEEQQEGESSEQSGEDSKSGESGDESDKQQESGKQQEGDEEAEQGKGKPGDKPQSQEDYAASWSEEDAQAMEQWLRRIPDDPGGLLRRKFINENQRRGAPEDEAEPW